MIDAESFSYFADSYTERSGLGHMVFRKEWSSGGMEGGGCWDECFLRPFSGDEEPSFEYFDSFLTALLDNNYITSDQMLKASHIPYGDYYSSKMLTEGEDEGYCDYYGNYCNIAFKEIYVNHLYEYMIENKLLC